MKEHCTAIVLAAGREEPKITKTAKQYLNYRENFCSRVCAEVLEQSS